MTHGGIKIHSSVGRISEWEGLRSRRRGVGVGPRPPQKNFAFFASKSHVCDALWHPFEVIFITGWKWTTMHKMVHFAMLQTTKCCSRIQVKTHSTMLANAPLPQMVGFVQIMRINCPSSRVIIFNNSNFTAVKKRLRCKGGGVEPPNSPSGYATENTHGSITCDYNAHWHKPGRECLIVNIWVVKFVLTCYITYFIYLNWPLLFSKYSTALPEF